MKEMNLKESLPLRFLVVVALPLVASVPLVVGRTTEWPNVGLRPVFAGVCSAVAVAIGCQVVFLPVRRLGRLAGMLLVWFLLASLLEISMTLPHPFGLWFFLVGLWIGSGLAVGVIADSLIAWNTTGARWRFSVAEILAWMVLTAVAVRLVDLPTGGLLIESILIGGIVIGTTAWIAWLVSRNTHRWLSVISGILLLGVAAVAFVGSWSWIPEGYPEYTVTHSLALYVLLGWVIPLPWAVGYPVPLPPSTAPPSP